MDATLPPPVGVSNQVFSDSYLTEPGRWVDNLCRPFAMPPVKSHAAACAEVPVHEWPGLWVVAVALHPGQIWNTVETIQGFEVPCYVPRVKSERFDGNRKRVTSGPLFPGGYIFACCQNEHYLPERLSDWMISQIIRVNDQPKIRTELGIIVKAIEADPFASLYSHKMVGQLVEIVGGPLRGQRGTIESFGKRDVLVVRIETLGQSVAVDISSSLVDAA